MELLQNRCVALALGSESTIGMFIMMLQWMNIRPNEIIFQVTGIVVMETVKAPQHSPNSWLIDTVYSEFNSGAWLVNLGVFEPTNCSAATR